MIGMPSDSGGEVRFPDIAYIIQFPIANPTMWRGIMTDSVGTLWQK